MRRHDRDVVSLMAGLLLVLVAGLFLLADATAVGLDARWIAPVALVGAGLAGLAATLRPSRREAPQDRPPA